MGPLHEIRTDGLFTRRGRKYSFSEKLVYALLISEKMRCGLSLRPAIAAMIDDDTASEGIKLTTAERLKAVQTGYRRYYEWRPEFLDEYDEERILRANFARIGMKVTNVEFRGVRPLGERSVDAILSPLTKRGRPPKHGRPLKRNA